MAATYGTVDAIVLSTGVTSFSESMDIGTEAADRIVAIGVCNEFSGSYTVTALSIGGISVLGTMVEAPHGTSFRRAIVAWALIPTGATVTVAGTFTGTGAGNCILFSLPVYGIGTSPTPTDTLIAQGNGTVAGGTIDKVEDGITIAASFFNNTGTQAWTGLTELSDQESADTGMRAGYAAEIPPTTAAAQTIETTASGGAVDWCFAAVTFSPAAGTTVPFLPLLGVGA